MRERIAQSNLSVRWSREQLTRVPQIPNPRRLLDSFLSPPAGKPRRARCGRSPGGNEPKCSFHQITSGSTFLMLHQAQHDIAEPVGRGSETTRARVLIARLGPPRLADRGLALPRL